MYYLSYYCYCCSVAITSKTIIIIIGLTVFIVEIALDLKPEAPIVTICVITAAIPTKL